MKNNFRMPLFALSLGLTQMLSAQDQDASHYFEYHPKGTVITVFETEIFHGRETVKINGKDLHFTTENNTWGVDTNYYWDDAEYFYKYYPDLHFSDNFLPKKVHLNQEWVSKSGKHKYHVAKTLPNLEVSSPDGEKSTYHDVIHIIMSPTTEGLYSPYHYYYAKGFGIIKIVHESNVYALKYEPVEE